MRGNGLVPPVKIAVSDTHKYHANPRLSANQVGDYLSANATNRRRILSDAKYPSTMILIRYEDARTAVASHLATGGAKNILADALTAIKRKADKDGITTYKKQNHKLC